ncbi:MAG: hypothetical protein GY754_18235 [bacterium]|nr:hypothetical protein [bacterium]
MKIMKDLQIAYFVHKAALLWPLLSDKFFDVKGFVNYELLDKSLVKRINMAIQYCDWALASDPKSQTALSLKAHFLMKLKRLRDAIYCYDALLSSSQTKPGDVVLLSFYRRALCYLHLGEKDQAFMSLKRLNTLNAPQCIRLKRLQNEIRKK